MATFDSMFGLMNPQGLDPLAFGDMLQKNPEALAPVLAQLGPPPPTSAPGGGPARYGGQGAPPGILSQIQQGVQSILPSGGVARYGQQAPPRPAPPANLPGFSEPGGFSSGAGFLNLPFPNGASPSQVPLPTARPTGGGAPLDLAATGGMPTGSEAMAAAQPTSAQNLQKALQGIKAPAAPQVQRISSPNAPRPQQIDQRSQIVALMQQLMGQQQQPQLRLGQALGGLR